MINLEWFRTFKVIYEAGTLSAAAQALFISQPGVSLHLSSLESYTGHRLFDRDTRKMKATERGTLLYNYIIEHMNKLEEAEHMFHKKSKLEKPTISVGIPMEMFQYLHEAHIPELPFNLVTRFGEYSHMMQELNSGSLDLILTTEKGNQHNLEFTPFAKERIVLICGKETDTTELDVLIENNERKDIKNWLATQTWYATAADMEHLKHFWAASFNALPVFRPNYIVPNFGSMLRCLSNGKGFAVVSDFLCRKEIGDNVVKLAWEGNPPVENILHFAKRKTTAFTNEIKQLENILAKNWPSCLEPEIV